MNDRRSKLQSFLRGFGSVLDVSGSSFRPAEKQSRMTDKQALRSDWDAIGGDFRKAMKANRPKRLPEHHSSLP